MLPLQAVGLDPGAAKPRCMEVNGTAYCCPVLVHRPEALEHLASMPALQAVALDPVVNEPLCGRDDEAEAVNDMREGAQDSAAAARVAAAAVTSEAAASVTTALCNVQFVRGSFHKWEEWSAAGVKIDFEAVNSLLGQVLDCQMLLSGSGSMPSKTVINQREGVGCIAASPLLKAYVDDRLRAGVQKPQHSPPFMTAMRVCCCWQITRI